MRYIIVLGVFIINIALSQQVYELPFPEGREELAIELTVANTSEESLQGIVVEAVEIPEGMVCRENRQPIDTLRGKGEEVVGFRFVIEKTVKVKEEQHMRFRIRDAEGGEWTKEIRIRVKAPEEFKVYQNYPNPFNPRTKISYTVPERIQRVSVRVYDMIGREVQVIAEGEHEAGYYEREFDGRDCASGVYVYRVIGEGEGKREIQTRKMVLMK